MGLAWLRLCPGLAGAGENTVTDPISLLPSVWSHQDCLTARVLIPRQFDGLAKTLRARLGQTASATWRQWRFTLRISLATGVVAWTLAVAVRSARIRAISGWQAAEACNTWSITEVWKVSEEKSTYMMLGNRVQNLWKHPTLQHTSLRPAEACLTSVWYATFYRTS